MGSWHDWSMRIDVCLIWYKIPKILESSNMSHCRSQSIIHEIQQFKIYNVGPFFCDYRTKSSQRASKQTNGLIKFTTCKVEGNTTLRLPPLWNVMLLHFLVGLNLYVILKWALERLEGPQRLLIYLKVNTCNKCKQPRTAYLSRGKPLAPTWLAENIYLTHIHTFLIFICIIGGRMQNKSSVRKVTHMSSTPTLSGLGVPMGSMSSCIIEYNHS